MKLEPLINGKLSTLFLIFLSIDKFITDGLFCVRGNIDDNRRSLRFAGHKMATQKIREDYHSNEWSVSPVKGTVNFPLGASVL